MMQLTDASEQFDPECSEDEKEQKEEKTEIADFRQSLHHRVEQSADRLGHLQQFQH